ncbi:MAG: isoprenylcysteine carboxylmethyltransferase family protein [Bacteroidota bacterium]
MNKLYIKSYLGLANLVFIIALLLFLPVWSVYYWQAWLYIATFTISVMWITAYFLKHDTELIKRRLKAGPAAENEKGQKIIQSLASVAVIGIIIVSAFDHRFKLSEVSVVLTIVSNVFIYLGFYIVFLVFKENSFTSAIIEVADSQKVISTGPYSTVRHPMYSGALLLFVFTPLALDSYFGLLLSVMLILVLVFRLQNEEAFLKTNLVGYTEYCEKVKYRLVPWIW